jgi:hypothetical protein
LHADPKAARTRQSVSPHIDLALQEDPFANDDSDDDGPFSDDEDRDDDAEEDDDEDDSAKRKAGDGKKSKAKRSKITGRSFIADGMSPDKSAHTHYARSL